MDKWLPFVLGSLCVVFGWLNGSAQYRFDSWTTDNGLPQNSIRGIAQTPDGYLWFTTLDGLVRFDGLKFYIFNKANSTGLTTNQLFNLRASRDGSLWISTLKNELVIFRDGKFFTHRAEPILGGGNILGFISDEDGNVLIEAQKGVYSFKNDQFELVRGNEDDGTQKQVLFGPSGTKWTVFPTLVTEEKGGTLRSYHIENKSVTYYDARMFEDASGALWVGDMGKLWSMADGKAIGYNSTAALPANTRPHRFWQDPDGSIWFATGDFNLKGVGLVRLKEGIFSRFGLESGLSNDRILAVFKDREGTIWLATDKGINRLRSSLITPLSTKDGLINDEVYPILKARDGSIYVGSNGGLSRYKDGIFKNYVLKFANDRASTVAIQALGEDISGKIWIGVSGGLFVLENGEPKDITKVLESNPTIWAIHAAQDGTVWLATERDGVVIMRDGQVASRLTAANGLASNDVKFIHPAADGSYWFGTYGGLSHYYDGRFQNFTLKDGLASDSVRSLKEDVDGTLWIGTYDGGISRFRHGKFFNFNTGNGLFSDGAFAIVEDKQGRFWITSNQGIYSADKSDLNAVADGQASMVTTSAYGKQDGMLNTECNGGRQPSSITDDDGRIWFPTMNGVAIVSPDLIQKNPQPPPVAIESVKIDREEVDFAEPVSLAPPQTQLDITYTGLSFIKSDQVHFKYRLGGLDEDWIDAGTRRTVSYSHLPAGDYVFTVTAANSDRVWNNQGKSINIRVIAPFYGRWWFISLLTLTLVGVGFLIYSNRIAQLKKLNTAQETFSRQLIESQEAERKRIAQEIHDGLGQSLLVIKNRASLGLGANEKNKADEQFGEIRESVTHALSEVRVIAQNLRPLHLERLGLTSTLQDMIEQLDEASEIEINYDIDQMDGKLTPENEINLYRIVQECLNNVVKHSGAGKATVSANVESERIILSVRDNGGGFDGERSGDNGGMGLNGIQERAKILGGSLTIHSELGHGTMVLLEIPLSRS